MKFSFDLKIESYVLLSFLWGLKFYLVISAPNYYIIQYMYYAKYILKLSFLYLHLCNNYGTVGPGLVIMYPHFYRQNCRVS